MVKKNKKRFIAGARCPQCQAQDTLHVYEQYPIHIVACTDCSYKEQRITDEAPSYTSDGVIGLFKPKDPDG